MHIARSLAVVAACSLAGCVWQPYPQPPPRQSSRPDPVPMTVRPASEEAPHPTQVGYLFYFRSPVPEGWSIVETPHDGGPDATTTPLCVLEKGEGVKVIILLKSYVPPDLTVDAYKASIQADPDAWLARLPAEFRSPAPVSGKEKGFIAVGGFPGLDGRWLIGAGRWPADAHEAMTERMKSLFVSVNVASTEARLDGIVVDRARQICAAYY